MIGKITSAALVLLLAAGHFPSAAAQEGPRAIGKYGAWQALTFEENGKTGCYIISEPERSEGNYSSRGKVYALVTHRPDANQLNVVTVIAGYNFKPDSDVVVEIGDQVFKLFTSKGTAWTPTEEGDRQMVAAMKEGSGMVVRGVSARDTETVDTYSLQGFTRAYNAIGEACGL
jgi:invasion protein IalB